MDSDADDEIVLDPEVPGIRIALIPIEAQPPRGPAPAAGGFPEDEFAVHAPDGRVVAFLREPVGRCHFDRLLLLDGERRIERPLPAWVYYGHFLRFGRRLLVGGAHEAWIVDWDGNMTTLFQEPDADGIPVGWVGDDTAVAAGLRQIVVDGPKGRVTLPCNHAVSVCAVAPDLAVVSDDDGSQWIRGGRVVARHWRPYVDGRGDVIISQTGDAYRVRVSAG